MRDHGKVTVPLPPETSTPMPPCLWYIYDRNRGWPGKPEDYIPDIPYVVRLDPAPTLFQRWKTRLLG